MMKKPKMILFDYGQTLVNETRYNAIRGMEAVLQYATENKYHLSARQVQEKADELNKEIGRFAPPSDSGRLQIELPNRVFAHYLYESLGIKLDLPPEEIDAVFWNAEAPGKPTEGIQEFLAFLFRNGIRTGVISNIPYAGKVVENKIQKYIPDHCFEITLKKLTNPLLQRVHCLQQGIVVCSWKICFYNFAIAVNCSFRQSYSFL